MAYVDSAKKNGNVYDIHDSRIPMSFSTDVGKILTVDEYGYLKWQANNPVTANPSIPEGANVSDLTRLKIGNSYYKIKGLSVTSGESGGQSILHGITVDGTYYKINYNQFTFDEGWYLELPGGNVTLKFKESQMNSACIYFNLLLQQLQMTVNTTDINSLKELWQDTGPEGTSGTPFNQTQYAFLIMAAMLLSFNTAGIELLDHQTKIRVYFQGGFEDQSDPSTAYIILYYPSFGENNGSYTFSYVGTKYTAADTQSFMSISFQLD